MDRASHIAHATVLLLTYLVPLGERASLPVGDERQLVLVERAWVLTVRQRVGDQPRAGPVPSGDGTAPAWPKQ